MTQNWFHFDTIFPLFNDSECIILSPEFKIVDESMILLRTPRKDNVYCLDLENVSSNSSLKCLFSKASSNELSFWHKRTCHMNFKNMNKLVKNNLVKGLPQKEFSCDDHCLLHTDLFGPTNVISIGKKSYYLVIVDDYSRFSWVFFLRTKERSRDSEESSLYIGDSGHSITNNYRKLSKAATLQDPHMVMLSCFLSQVEPKRPMML
ncbi:hypothetical protein OSB04_029402 [Centaurea solstitialis]|uniref:GAG-pre-integrase domain-containing protein n=1 Tax=Centaurea solstitialis TaxID=347529 RepID=A0AA38SVX5_9ASTR|nr:hypothetical protein OSB04_029402 [Centaurea solstitialis]